MKTFSALNLKLCFPHFSGRFAVADWNILISYHPFFLSSFRFPVFQYCVLLVFCLRSDFFYSNLRQQNVQRTGGNNFKLRAEKFSSKFVTHFFFPTFQYIYIYIIYISLYINFHSRTSSPETISD